jgi:hypothetical protein
MGRPVRKRFWIELALGVTSCLLLLLTLATREWIELVFGVDPDNGSGALEWAIVASLTLATLLFGALARRERRTARLRPDSAAVTRA